MSIKATPEQTKAIAYDMYLKNRIDILSLCKSANVPSLIDGFSPAWVGCSPKVFEGHADITGRRYHNVLASGDVLVRVDFARVASDLNVPSYVHRDTEHMAMVFGKNGFIPRKNEMPTAVGAYFNEALGEATLQFEWKANGMLHRTTNPATVEIKLDNSGTAKNIVNSYYIENKPMHRDEFVQWYEMTYLEEYRGL